MLFVKRGDRYYMPALKARLRANEDVYIRQPDGSFQFIGTTDARADLPDLPTISHETIPDFPDKPRDPDYDQFHVLDQR